MEIKVRNLVRSFGMTRAVDDISFEFAAGNVFGFIGPNGAGKTTTIRIMGDARSAGFRRCFLRRGVSVVNYPEEVRRLVGYMPDSLPDFRDIQVWEYLDFFARSFGSAARSGPGLWPTSRSSRTSAASAANTWPGCRRE